MPAVLERPNPLAIQPTGQTNNAPNPRTPTWTVLSPSSSPVLEPTVAIVSACACPPQGQSWVSSTFALD